LRYVSGQSDRQTYTVNAILCTPTGDEAGADSEGVARGPNGGA